MKRSLALALAFSLASVPAFAARVTNLDTTAHVVQFEFAGSVQEQTVAPNGTVTFPRQDGFVSLKGGTPATSHVTSDGLLQGAVGNARSAGLPAGPGDDFVIWKGGKITLQHRIKSFNKM